MRLNRTFVLATLGVLGFGGSVRADLILFTADLNGANERPVPVVTPGTGFATFLVDDIANTVAFNISYQSLLAGLNPGAGHIHLGGVNQAGGIFFPLPNVPTGTTSGNFFGTLTAANFTATGNPPPGVQNVQQGIAAIKAGNSYVNLHTTLNPGGEIRGQLVRQQVIPEPSTFALLGIGVIGVVGYMWRRRK